MVEERSEKCFKVEVWLDKGEVVLESRFWGFSGLDAAESEPAVDVADSCRPTWALAQAHRQILRGCVPFVNHQRAHVWEAKDL